MNNQTKVQKLIFNMLTENTGTHFLDSGGTDGRMWQRNGAKSIEDFLDEPEEVYELSKWGKSYEIERTVSVFHFLAGNGSCLELDDICDKFNNLQDKNDNWDSKFYGVSIEAYNYIYNVGEFDSADRYGMLREFNTYNGDSDLSQVLQGRYIKIDDELYLILQIHGGADVRGGYTHAKLFKVDDDYLINEYLQEYREISEINDDIQEEYLTLESFVNSDGQKIELQDFAEYLNDNNITLPEFTDPNQTALSL